MSAVSTNAVEIILKHFNSIVKSLLNMKIINVISFLNSVVKRTDQATFNRNFCINK